jgi:hypothetical protein
MGAWVLHNGKWVSKASIPAAAAAASADEGLVRTYTSGGTDVTDDAKSFMKMKAS